MVIFKRFQGTLLLFCLPCFGQTYRIDTVAGGAMPFDVPGPSANLGLVTAAVADANGNVYLALHDYHLVVKLDKNGFLTRFAGGGAVVTGFTAGDGLPATSVSLADVNALALDSTGNLYLAEAAGPAGNGYVRRVSNGVITTVTRSDFAWGIAVDGAGSLYMADYWQVLKYSNGATASIAGCYPSRDCTTPAAWADPEGYAAPGGYLTGAEFVALDGSGNVYFAMNACGNTASSCSGTVRRLIGGTIYPIAGGGSATGENVPAIGYALHRIDGIAVDAAGTLYIAEDDGIAHADDGGKTHGWVRKVVGGTINTVATGLWPSALALDAAGNLWVPDFNTGVVVKIDGSPTPVAGSRGPWPGDEGGAATSAHLIAPRGVAAGADGAFYIADSGNNVVRKVSGGVITTVAGGGASLAEGVAATSARLTNPTAVAVGGNGDLYISETDANVVRKVAGGIITTVAGDRTAGFNGDQQPAAEAELSAPAGLALDSAGALYIADSGNNRVRKVWEGTITTVAGNGQGGGTGPYGGPATSAYIWTPNSVAVDAAGNLYITDAYGWVSKVSNGIITKTAYNGLAVAAAADGTIYTVGLNGSVVNKGTAAITATSVFGDFGGDGGAASQALLNHPAGLAVAPSGDIYVADTGNNRIRVLTPDACAAAIQGQSVAIPAVGGTFPYSIGTGAGCAWSVSALPNWLAVSGAEGGSGPAVIELIAGANSGPPRVADISIAGEAIPVLQYGSGSAAPACSFTLDPADQHVPTSGGYYSVYTPPAPAGGSLCRWSVGTTADWITLYDGQGNPGHYFEGAQGQSWAFRVATNTGVARTATVDYGGTEYTIQQDASCLVLNPGAASFSAGDNTAVFVASACDARAWRIISSPSWVYNVAASDITGTFSVYYEVQPNFGAARKGTITLEPVGGPYPEQVSFIIQQEGQAGLLFVPVTPCRVADTRNTPGAFGGPSLGTEETRTFVVSQSACGIPAAARAYSLNVTAVPKGYLGFLALWPGGEPQPTVSTLNSFGGEVVANAAIVPAGQGGAVNVFVSDPSDVVVDIDGYFDPSPSVKAYSYYPVSPCRAVDTRNAEGPLGGPGLEPYQGRDFPIPQGPCSVDPAAGAYSLNATVVPGGPLAYLTLWPTGQAQPYVSTLNSATGRIVANAAIVPAGSSGAVSAFATGSTDLVLDLNGYFGTPNVAGVPTLLFYPVTPCRIADTRNADGAFGGPELAAGETRSFAIPSGACNIPDTAEAYSLNVTVVPDGPLAYLTAWPTGWLQPFVSTLNSPDAAVVANAAIVPTAMKGGAINVFVTEAAHVILDINGFFAR